MYKTAFAALALALSFGLNYTQAFGQTTSDNKTADQSGQSQATTSDQKSTDQKTPEQTTAAPAPKPAATAAPATPAAYVQNYGWSKSGAPIQQPAASPEAAPVTRTTGATRATGASAADRATAAPVSTTTTASKKKDEIVVIQQSPDKLYVSKGNKWQTFDSYITLRNGQDALPLTMTVTNAGYKGIVMFLSGSKLASDKDFKGNLLTMQMTGALSGGDNKLTIQGLGPPGASLSWKLTTKKPVITAVTPTSSVIEAEVKISGRNFAKQASANKVLVGKIAVTPRFSAKDLVINVPKEAQGGKTTIVVEIGGIASKPFDFLVKFAPEVTSVDLISSPPGQPLTITGKGFSPVRGENQVMIGGMAANIVSESATSITCIVPELQYPVWNVPVVVKSGGVESKKNGTLNLNVRVIPNDGVPQLYTSAPFGQRYFLMQWHCHCSILLSRIAPAI